MRGGGRDPAGGSALSRAKNCVMESKAVSKLGWTVMVPLTLNKYFHMTTANTVTNPPIQHLASL